MQCEVCNVPDRVAELLCFKCSVGLCLVCAFWEGHADHRSDVARLAQAPRDIASSLGIWLSQIPASTSPPSFFASTTPAALAAIPTFAELRAKLTAAPLAMAAGFEARAAEALEELQELEQSIQVHPNLRACHRMST